MSELIKEIIAKIETYNGTFPKEELQILIDNKQESTPFLLESLSDAEKLYQNLEDDYNDLPFFSFFLLAQFRENKAYPLIYEIFSFDAKTVSNTWDDLPTAGLGNILASVSDGDTSLINKLIFDKNVNEWVRSAGITAWLCLLKANLKTREETIAFLKSLFELPNDDDELFRTWVVGACLDIRASELMSEIQKSFEDDLIDLTVFGNWDEYQEFWNNEKFKDFENNSEFVLIDDTISYLGQWHSFMTEDEQHAENERIRAMLKESELHTPVTENIIWESRYDGTFQRETPKLGKNDPCSCGSGRKYKKCCMN